MKASKEGNKDDVQFKNLPIEGSLGILAYGDVAFLQWREVKKANNRGEDKL